MCNFITLIVPTSNEVSVHAVMARHGRKAQPSENHSIQNSLHIGDYQYLTNPNSCDCGTILGYYRSRQAAHEQKMVDDKNRMARKGWSSAKIARAIEGYEKKLAKPRQNTDSIELWDTILHDLFVNLKLPYVGLFVGMYSGIIETEIFTPERRDVSKTTDIFDALKSLECNQINFFYRN